jgi:hypothetical protein
MTSQARRSEWFATGPRRPPGGLAELVPVLAAAADLGAFRLAYAAGDPLRARFKPRASGVRNMAVPSRFKAR